MKRTRKLTILPIVVGIFLSLPGCDAPEVKEPPPPPQPQSPNDQDLEDQEGSESPQAEASKPDSPQESTEASSSGPTNDASGAARGAKGSGSKPSTPSNGKGSAASAQALASAEKQLSAAQSATDTATGVRAALEGWRQADSIKPSTPSSRALKAQLQAELQRLDEDAQASRTGSRTDDLPLKIN